MVQSQDRISFHDQIARNKRNSVFLMLFIAVVIIGLGYVIGLIYSDSFFFILIIAIIVSLLYTLIGYYNSDKIALASVNARGADRRDYPQYYSLVEGLTIASGLPMPRLYIMENEQINAFASGRDPKHAVVCVTTGTLQKLNKQELEGVLSHELSHIASFDIRFMTLVAVMVGMVAIISEIFLRSLWYGRGESRNSDNSKGNAVLMIIGLVLAILAPIAVQLVQLAISRKREFSADASAVKFTRSTTGLIGALEKIKKNSEMKVSGAVAPLFLAKPSRASNLFQTHPPLEQRIEILKRM